VGMGLPRFLSSLLCREKVLVLLALLPVAEADARVRQTEARAPKLLHFVAAIIFLTPAPILGSLSWLSPGMPRQGVRRRQSGTQPGARKIERGDWEKILESRKRTQRSIANK
jgi:hypothetical protein